jgi:hypothetical protein
MCRFCDLSLPGFKLVLKLANPPQLVPDETLDVIESRRLRMAWLEFTFDLVRQALAFAQLIHFAQTSSASDKDIRVHRPIAKDQPSGFPQSPGQVMTDGSIIR